MRFIRVHGRVVPIKDPVGQAVSAKHPNANQKLIRGGLRTQNASVGAGLIGVAAHKVLAPTFHDVSNRMGAAGIRGAMTSVQFHKTGQHVESAAYMKASQSLVDKSLKFGKAANIASKVGRPLFHLGLAGLAGGMIATGIGATRELRHGKRK